MEAILWENGARGINELEELRMEQENALVKSKGLNQDATPGMDSTVSDAGFRAWKRDFKEYEPVYQLGVDIPG